MSKAKNENKKSNKALIIVCVVIFAISSILSLTLFGYFYVTNYGVKPTIDEKSQNIIMLFMDEIEENHAAYQNLSDVEVNGNLKTRSLNLRKSDMAAKASAMASGKKVFNKNINYLFGEQVENLGDIVAKTDKKYGLISLRNSTNEIVSAFTAHNENYENKSQIAHEQLSASDFDLLVGVGNEYYKEHSELLETETRAYCESYYDLRSNEKSKAILTLKDKNEVDLATLSNYMFGKLSGQNGFFAVIDAYDCDGDEINNTINAVRTFLTTLNANTTIIIVCGNDYYMLGKGVQNLPKELDNTDIFLIAKQLLV